MILILYVCNFIPLTNYKYLILYKPSSNSHSLSVLQTSVFRLLLPFLHLASKIRFRFIYFFMANPSCFPSVWFHSIQQDSFYLHESTSGTAESGSIFLTIFQGYFNFLFLNIIWIHRGISSNRIFADFVILQKRESCGF